MLAGSNWQHLFVQLKVWQPACSVHVTLYYCFREGVYYVPSMGCTFSYIYSINAPQGLMADKVLEANFTESPSAIVSQYVLYTARFDACRSSTKVHNFGGQLLLKH